jgi:Holliday junction resolvase RusA-like endonuclease
LEKMKRHCTITIDEACPGKVVGVQEKARRHRMKENEKQWMKKVKKQYKDPKFDGSVRVEVDFARKKWKGNSPDLDNMLKVVFDALKTYVIDDDRHIIQAEAKKLSGEDSTVIRVYTL